MDKPNQDWTRRDLLHGAVAASAGALAGGCASTGGPAAAGRRQPKLIERENARTGADDWQLGRVAIPGQGSAAVRSTFIEGYCSHQSIEAGQTLQVMVSVKPACPFTVEVFRMG